MAENNEKKRKKNFFGIVFNVIKTVFLLFKLALLIALVLGAVSVCNCISGIFG